MPATAGADGPLTTGRAIVDVRTPRLPPPGGTASAMAASSELLDRVARRDGIDVDGRSVPAGFITTDLDGESIASLRSRLADDPLVQAVRPEYRAEYRYLPDDPALHAADPNAPGGDTAQWNLLGYGVEGAWNLARGGGGEVAVIDSGIDPTHPDLAPRISGTLSCAGLLGSCGGLGSTVADTEGHGTHVAGLACAAADNSYGIASIGFGCTIYAIKTSLSYTSIINSIYAAVAHGADAINMSFGGGGADPNLDAAISYAWSNGVVPVAAADNSPAPAPQTNYPAQYIQPEGTGPNLSAGRGLVVTSASHSGARSLFAQGTPGVSVAAFGSASDVGSGGQQGILSTWPSSPVTLDSYGVRTSVNGDNRFAYLSGTSMASPQVAGLVALMRSGKPGLSAARLVQLTKLTASNCGSYGGGLGWGVIRADQALSAATGHDINPPTSRVMRVRRSQAKPGLVIVKLRSSDIIGTPSACSREIPSSGVRAVAIFVSVNHHPFHRVTKTRRNRVEIHAKRGRAYRFFAVATDETGNREATPIQPEAKLSK